MTGSFIGTQGRDSTCLWQARNFTIENKFSSEGCLANCHWRSATVLLAKICKSAVATPQLGQGRVSGLANCHWQFSARPFLVRVFKLTEL